MSGLDPISFAGVLDIIEPFGPVDPSVEKLDQEVMQDDLEGEQETIPNSEDQNTTHVMELLTTLNEVSRGVSDGTHQEYQR
jgi:hypothetical protein